MPDILESITDTLVAPMGTVFKKEFEITLEEL